VCVLFLGLIGNIEPAALTSRMAKHVCYIHVGPHKTGTTSIQWFLKENRAELLRHGYFVPESGTIHGGHHPLVRQLCGQGVPEHQQDVAAKFTCAIKDTICEAVVLSAESLGTLLANRDCAKQFFNQIRELNLEPKLVFFPRNQSQLLNSRYTEVVKGFRRFERFETFVQAEVHHPCFRYSHLSTVANAFGVKFIARPFTEETIARGVIPEFLRAIGIDTLPFPETKVRRNQRAGPFSISVARDVLRSMDNLGRELTWLQASRCEKKATAYLDERGLADSGYCGLTTALARCIETQCRADNDSFAQQLWGRSWEEVFGVDVGREFKPNDFDICPPSGPVRRRLRRAVRGISAIVRQVLLDPAFAVEAPWNDLRKRSGFGFSRIRFRPEQTDKRSG
jgi:hypothetical protein